MMMTTMTVCLGTKTRRIAGTGSHQKAEALPPQEKRKLAKAGTPTPGSSAGAIELKYSL
jgi:hypothetical protein